MLIDCGTCRGHAEGRCGDCVVTVLGTLPRPRVVRPPVPPTPPGRDARRFAVPSPGSSGTTAGPDLSAPNLLEPDLLDPHQEAAVAFGWLPLDRNEQAAVELFVRAGLIDPDEAAQLRARPATWRRHRAVG